MLSLLALIESLGCRWLRSKNDSSSLGIVKGGQIRIIIYVCLGNSDDISSLGTSLLGELAASLLAPRLGLLRPTLLSSGLKESSLLAETL